MRDLLKLYLLVVFLYMVVFMEIAVKRRPMLSSANSSIVLLDGRY